MIRTVKTFLTACTVVLCVAGAAGAQTVDWTDQFGTLSNDAGRAITSDGSALYVTGTVGPGFADAASQYTWRTTPTGTPSQLYGVAHASPLIAVAVGASGTIVRTSDGGSSWSQVTSPTGDWLYGVDFLDLTLGMAVGQSGTVLKTSDNGLNWTMPLNGPPFVLYDVEVISNTVAVAVGSGGTVIRSTDGGGNWGAVTSNTTATLRGVHFATPAIGVAVGTGGAIIRTTDGGLTWNPVASGVAVELRAVHFGDAANGLVVGDGGVVLRTDDGGASWSQETSGFAGLFAGVHLGADGHAAALGNSGEIYRSADFGVTWAQQPGGAITGEAISFGDTKRAIAVGSGGSALQSVPQGPGGGTDILVRKYDLTGGLVWETQFGSPATDEGYAVASDGSRVYVGGVAWGALPGQTHAGNQDAFLAAFSADGILLWLQQWGNIGTEVVYGLGVDDGLYAAGMVNGADVLLRKYDPATGALLWDQSFSSGGGVLDFAWDVFVAAPGEIYVAGYTAGTLPGLTSQGGDDFFVRRIDAAGAEVWTLQDGSTGSDYARGVFVDGTGVYVTGAVGGVFDGNPYAAGSDVFVAKYDLGGATLLWSEVVGGSGNDVGQGIRGDGTGVTVAGEITAALPGQTFLGGASDGFARRYLPDGTPDWTAQVGSAGNDIALGVARVGGDDFLSGSTSGTLPGETSAGVEDAFAMKLVETPAVPGIVYVDGNGTPDLIDGQSWASAYTDLQSALAAAIPGDSIWVADGTYTPTAGTDRTATFTLQNNVTLVGGFAGGETSVSQRDWDANPAILSGDIGAPADTVDNSYHVLTAGSGVDSTAVLDGFVVTGGNSRYVSDGGGALLIDASPVIRNTTFIGNYAFRGGAAHVYLGGPRFESCTFGGFGAGEGNGAQAGGAVFNDVATTVFTDCVFRGNSAPPNNGGATDNAFGANTTYIDCVFDGNSALQGGGVHIFESEASLTRCTFINNSATSGAGVMMLAPIGAAAAPGADGERGTAYAPSPGADRAWSDGPARAAAAGPGDLSVVDCDFELNNASGDAGGLHFYGLDGTITNSRFYDNTAGGSGGAIAQFQGTLVVTNCSIVSNDAFGPQGGGGLYVGFSVSNVESSILWGNAAVAAGSTLEAQIRNNGGGVNTANSVVEGLPAFADNNNTGRDPLFVDWVEGGDLHLQLASPAINRGSNGIMPAEDLDGNPRVSAGAVDAGAYEYQVVCPPGSRLYVRSVADGGDGTSWVDAYKYLEDALAMARLCGTIDEIWVAAGTYVPSRVDDRMASFQLADQVAVYGGFAFGDTDLSQRDIAGNPTVLSGDLGVPADSTDNSYHVVVAGAGIDPGTRLDGVTVTGGFANGGGDDNNGAGLFNTFAVGAGSPDIANVIFTGNHASSLGGGVANDGAPTFENVVFEFNMAQGDGGGLWQGNTGAVIFRNCEFRYNQGLFGGGIRTGGPCEFTNVVFLGNQAVGGGGMQNFGDAVLTNVTFSGNSAGSFGGGGMSTGDAATPTVINSIFWANTATEGSPNIFNEAGAAPDFSYSLVEGSNGSGAGWLDSFGTDGGNNIDQDPLFVSGGDLHIIDISPAANAGSNAAPNLLATDLDGNDRVVGGVVDMGAYESSFLADTDGDGIIDTADLCPLEDATNFDRNNDGCIDEGAGARHVEYWGEPDTVLTYVVHEDGVPGAGVSAIPAIQAAFDSWNAVAGTVQQAVYGGTTAQFIADPFDGVNLVTGADTDYPFGSATLAVGLTTSFVSDSLYGGRTYRAGEIVDSDMIFNPAKTFTTSGGTGSDVQAVATHEAGHMFGVSHSAVITSTMFYVLPPGTLARTLESDDVVAFRKSYPDGGTLAAANRIEGQVYDAAGNVIPGAIVFVTDAATGDTTACDYTLPNGRYSFIGIPDGSYNVSIHPLNGSSAIGYLVPERVNQIVTDTAVRVFPPEYYDDAESNVESDPLARATLVVSGGTQLSGIDLVINEDATPPVVVNVTPADGATDVPAASAILISFSEPIDSGTLVGNFSLTDSTTGLGVGGNAAFLNDDSLISFTPTSALSYNSIYELRLETGLEDLFGNGLAAPFVARFATEPVPPYGLTGLVPDKGVEGSVVVVTGNDLSSDPADLTVTFDGVEATILESSVSEIVVVVPPGASSGDVIVTKATAGATNAETFTVLPPAETFNAIEVGAVALGALPRSVDARPAGDYAYVATTAGAVAVNTDPGSTGFLSATAIPVTSGLRDIAVRPDGRRAYGVSFLGQSISVIDTDADTASPSFNTVLATVPTGAAPLGIAIDPAGQRAYVPDEDGDIEVWDVSQPSGVTLVGLIASPDPNIRGKMVIDPVRDELLVLAGTGKLLFFDLEGDSLLAEVTVGSDPRDIAIDAAAERAYVTDNSGFVTVVSLGSKFRVTPDITTGGSLRGVSLTPAGMFLFSANRQLNQIEVVDLDVGNSTFRTVVDQIPQGINPVDADVSPDGAYLYSLVEDTQQFVITAIGAGPSVETLSRYAGPVGGRVVLAGQSLSDSLVFVDFNGTRVIPDAFGATALAASVPAGATSGPVTVTTVNSGGTQTESNEVFFEVLGATPQGGFRLARRIGLPGTPELTTAMSVSPTGNVVVFGGETGELWVLDANPSSPTFEQVVGSSTPAGGSVDDVAVTPDGKRAYVLSAAAPELVEVNVNPLSPGFGTVLGGVDLSAIGTSSLRRIVVSPDGYRLVLSDPLNDENYVVDIDPDSPQHNLIQTGFALGTLTNGNVAEMAFHPAGRYVYLPVQDENGQFVAVGDLATGVVNVVDLGGTVPVEIPVDIAFTPDGGRAFMLTTQLSGPPNRSVVTIDTSDPTAPVLLNRQAFGGSLSPVPEHITVSPAGDRVVFGVRGEPFFYAEVAGDSIAVLGQGGQLFFHLTRTEMDYAPDASRLYATSQNLDSVYVYDFTTATTIAVDGGNAQTGVIDQELGSPLRVLVTDAGANPVPGVAVTFQVTAGGGRFVDTQSQTQVEPSGSDGIAEVRFELGGAIGAGTHTVEASAGGLSGSPLTFTFDAIDDPANLPLSVTSVIPATGSSSISVTTALQATFSRAVDRASVDGSTFFLRRDADGAIVSGVTGFTSDNKSISLTPNSPLAFNASYSFVIDGVVDDAGGPLTNPTTASFSTVPGAPPLSLEAVSPPSATTNVTVVLSGTSFDSIPGNNTVLFNDVATTPDAAGVDFLNVTVPLGAVTGTVRVVAGTDSSGTLPFTVIQPQTTDIDEVIATIGTGNPTKGLTISPDGTIAYSVSPGTGTVIPIDIAGETTYPPIDVGNDPIAITISPDGKQVFVANLTSGTVSVIDSDPASLTFHQRVDDIVVGTAPSDLVVSPDGDRLFVANGGSSDVSVIDSDVSSAAHLEVIATIGVGTGTKGITINPDGTELYVGNDQGYTIVDPLGYSVIATIGVGSSTKGLTISPDGTLLYLLTTEGEVLIIDNEPGSVTEDQVIATIGTGGGTKGLTINPDGTQLYLIQDESDLIIVVDIEVANSVSIIYEEQIPGRVNVTVADTLDVGEDPEALVFDPSGSGLALLTSPGDETIVFLSANPRTVVAGIFVEPRTINENSKGRFINGLIELPDPYLPQDIVLSSVLLNDTVPADPDRWTIADSDSNGIDELQVKFDRALFQVVMPQGEYVPVTISGELADGKPFAGEDTIRTIRPTLKKPASWSTLAPGEDSAIEWESPSGVRVDYVDVYFSADDGATWSTVAEGIPDAGSLAWTAPILYSEECRVMVTLYRDDESIGSGMNQYPFGVTSPVSVQMASVEIGMDGGAAVLRWETNAEFGTRGYHVYRSTERDGSYRRVTGEMVPAAGDVRGGSYEYRDLLDEGNRTYFYRLEEVTEGDEPMVFGPYAVEFKLSFGLDQNVPNPFNPTTTIRFSLASRSRVSLQVYDVAGRLVRTLVDESRAANVYDITWDGVNDHGERVASGVYFYRLVAGKFRATKKMVLLK